MKIPFTNIRIFEKKNRDVLDPIYQSGFGTSRWIGNDGVWDFSKILLDGRTALNIPVVWSCIEILTNTAAMLPLRLYKREHTERGIPISDTRSRIIGEKWNETTTAFEGIKFWLSQSLCEGVGYVFIKRNRTGKLDSLIPIPTRDIQATRKNGKTTYWYRPTSDEKMKVEPSATMLEPEDLLVLRYKLKSDGFTPVSAIDVCKDAIILYLLQDRSAMRSFTTGTPPFMITAPEWLQDKDAETQERIIHDLNQAVKMANEKGSNFFMQPSGTNLQKLGFSAEEYQFVDQRTYQLQEICRAFGVPPIMVHDLSKSTYANSEQSATLFLKHSLQPWLRKMEQEINMKIWPQPDGDIVEFDTTEYIRSDFMTRSSSMTTLVQNGIMTPNEARQRFDLPPSTQEGADELKMQMQMVSVDDNNEGNESEDTNEGKDDNGNDDMSGDDNTQEKN